MDIVLHRKTVSASHIGGIKATEECLELCAKNGILPETQMVTADKIDWVYEQLENNTEGLRYVIDIKQSLDNKDFVPK